MKKIVMYYRKKLKELGAGLKEDIVSQFCKWREHPLRSVLSGFAIVLVMVLIAGLVVYEKGHSYFMKSNYVQETAATSNQQQVTVQPEEPEDPELKEIREQLKRYDRAQPLTTDGNVYNILLVGVDRVKKTKNGNSDSMILISLNYKRKQISMISLMRDTYVHIPDIGYRKLNAAYANGGGQLLVETVTENLEIPVNRYMAVSFEDMVGIIDAIGKVWINFTEGEANNANKTMKSMCQKMGMTEAEIEQCLLPGAGAYQCNGIQTVAYARIRKVGNSDYQRTSRQREVLEKLLHKVKTMSIDEMDQLANELLPMITHNVPESEFWRLLAKAPTVRNYTLVQDRIPYDGLFYSKNECLVPDWDQTITKLQQTLYGFYGVDNE